MGLISGIPSNRLHFHEKFGVFLKGFDHFCITDGCEVFLLLEIKVDRLMRYILSLIHI